MSGPSITPTQNVGQLCLDLDRTIVTYAQQLRAKAEAESTFKAARARRVLRAKVDATDRSEKSTAACELVADADETIEALRLAYLIADGMVAATKERIGMLRERIGFGRSVMANEREQDRLHADNPAGRT